MRSSSEDDSTAKSVSVLNFRPNIVLRGGCGLAHQEDTFSAIEVVAEVHGRPSTIRLDISGPCARCSMINVTVHTNAATTTSSSSSSNSCNTIVAVDGRALEALGEYRKQGPKTFFGQFCNMSIESTAVVCEAWSALEGAHHGHSERYLASLPGLSEGAVVTPFLKRITK